MKSLLVIGAGGHAKTVISVAQAREYSISGVLDQSRCINESVLGVPILGEMSSYLRYIKSHCFVVAIGDNATRMNIFQALQLKAGQFATLVHPNAKIDSSAQVGLGAVIAQSAIVCPNARIGENVIVNSRALVEHDCIVEAHAHIGPDVSLAGKVTIKEGAFVGLRAVVKDGITIGKWAKIGAGAVVVSDVPEGATMVGNPARIVNIKGFPNQVQAPAPIFTSGITIREALEKMDYHGIGHGIVIRYDGTAIGIITDGLIRRYILANGMIDAQVDTVMYKDFFSLPKEREHEAIYHFSHLISFIPILDAQKKLLKVIEKSDVLSTLPQQQQGVALQMKQIFQWLNHREHQHYREENFFELWKQVLGVVPSAYHMSAETLLELLLFSLPNVVFSQCLKDWWPIVNLYSAEADSNKPSLIVKHVDEILDESAVVYLTIGGTVPKRGFRKPYFLRCDPSDQINLEGAGLIFNDHQPLAIRSRLHPMQMATGLPQLKALGSQ